MAVPEGERGEEGRDPGAAAREEIVVAVASGGRRRRRRRRGGLRERRGVWWGRDSAVGVSVEGAVVERLRDGREREAVVVVVSIRFSERRRLEEFALALSLLFWSL